VNDEESYRFAACLLVAFLVVRFSGPEKKRTANTHIGSPIKTVGTGPRYEGRMAQNSSVT
jgi:hypothetical protein